MTDETTPDDDHESLATTPTDPETLRAAEDVASEETTTVHDDREHFESHGHDIAVVGVTNDAGAICLFVNEDRAFAGLPWETVEDGDWIDAAHRSIEDWCTGDGMAISVDEPNLVRRVDHEIAGEEGVKATTHTILFRASPVAADPDMANLTGAEDWDAGWYDGIPAFATETPADVAADIRRFVE